MDNIYFAMAGLAMVVIGVAGFIVFALLALAASIRYSLAPRMRPLIARTRAGAVSWFAPPPVRRPAVAARVDRPRP